MNSIFTILNHLFKSIEVDDKLELMLNTYKRLFLSLKSSQLKTSQPLDLWTSHVNLLVGQLLDIQYTSWSMETSLARKAIELIELVVDFYLIF